MMQTLNPYNTGKTAEIMARYRPIAPKPDAPTNPNGSDNNSSLPEGIRKSPYLMNVWNQLQARPTRTRKRGRTALAPPIMKRTRTCLQGISPPYHYQVTANSPANALAFPSFVHDPSGLPQLSFLPNLVPLKCGLDSPVATPSNTVSVPFLPCNPKNFMGGDAEGGIDLNKAAEAPEELDFMQQLSEAVKGDSAVVKPQAIRLVGSSITVKYITEDPTARNGGKQMIKTAEEVEKEVESEALPAIISDSKNKVRLTNAAYNEMIGQPECLWYDVTSDGGAIARAGGGGACKRIGGEVVLDIVNSSLAAKISSNGFTCCARIEWGGKDGNKNVVNAFCDGIRLACESRDYLFEWRFRVREASESCFNV
ncbi:hypothetical protein ACH5RR_034891 [Cinchona calisaya]|uniref:DUF7950 domain-containing protein n=1 Tax=Cinchona calisaya TaxID=153742 RepID=A0ABD2YFT6_9GENT